MTGLLPSYARIKRRAWQLVIEVNHTPQSLEQFLWISQSKTKLHPNGNAGWPHGHGLHGIKNQLYANEVWIWGGEIQISPLPYCGAWRQGIQDHHQVDRDHIQNLL